MAGVAKMKQEAMAIVKKVKTVFFMVPSPGVFLNPKTSAAVKKSTR